VESRAKDEKGTSGRVPSSANQLSHFSGFSDLQLVANLSVDTLAV